MPPGEGDWQEAWELIQRSHAIANSVHVAAVNRTGREGDIRFFGGSFVCDAFGKLLARAGDKEEIILTRVDLGMNESIRDSWGFFRNRRPDTYGTICSRVPEHNAMAPIPRKGDTPRKLGFFMPAEWEPHDAVWLSWPHNKNTFPNLKMVEEGYVRFIAEVYTFRTRRNLRSHAAGKQDGKNTPEKAPVLTCPGLRYGRSPILMYGSVIMARRL